MGRLSGGWGRLWGGHSENVGRLSVGCGEVVWRVWGGSLKGLGRLYGGCGEVVLEEW